MAERIRRGAVLDRYRLEKKLGSGAFGEVWLATETGGLAGFERKVAIKLITAVTDPRKVRDLLHEARLCSAVQHPHVVRIDGIVQDRHAHFIVMEYVEGEDVASVFRDLRRRGLRMPRSVILDIGIAVCEGLHAAWTSVDDDNIELKIVHRDLKPHNVLLGRNGEVKVADFGIAKAAPDVTMTRAGVLKGTPTYGPPEMWMGSRDFKPATDLFGVGVMLWELATGKRFYGVKGIAEVLFVLGGRSPEEEKAAVAESFPELAELMPGLLERSPDRRLNDSAAVAHRLREIRTAIGAPGGIEQFFGLLEAARLERAPGVRYEPNIPLGDDLQDWAPLVAAARRGAPPLPPPARKSVPGGRITYPEAHTDLYPITVLRSGAAIPWIAAGVAAIVLLVIARAKGFL
jgi:serine/threonine-protein kinase